MGVDFKGARGGEWGWKFVVREVDVRLSCVYWMYRHTLGIAVWAMSLLLLLYLARVYLAST